MNMNFCSRSNLFASRGRSKACDYLKKETLAQVFSCEFWKVSKSNIFTENFRTTGSGVAASVYFNREAFLWVLKCKITTLQTMEGEYIFPVGSTYLTVKYLTVNNYTGLEIWNCESAKIGDKFVRKLILLRKSESSLEIHFQRRTFFEQMRIQ